MLAAIAQTQPEQQQYLLQKEKRKIIKKIFASCLRSTNYPAAPDALTGSVATTPAGVITFCCAKSLYGCSNNSTLRRIYDPSASTDPTSTHAFTRAAYEPTSPVNTIVGTFVILYFATSPCASGIKRSSVFSELSCTPICRKINLLIDAL